MKFQAIKVFFLLLVAILVRIYLGDALILNGDDNSYYHASRLIQQNGDLFAGARALRDIYSFRYLQTWLVALNWHFFGDSLASITFFPQLASLGLVILTLFLAHAHSNGRGNWLAGWIAALIPIGIQLSGTLSPDALLAFLSCFSLLLLLRAKPGDTRSYLLAGLVFSFSYFCKEESAKHLFPLLAVIAVQAKKENRWKTFLRNTFWFSAPIFLSSLLDLLLCHIEFGNPLARIDAAVANINMWKRMGVVDPEGRSWSYMYYIRRLLFPFGPMAFVFPIGLFGAFYYSRDHKKSALVAWFFLQTLILIIGSQLGQIQDRMLQVLIPSIALFSAYGITEIESWIKNKKIKILLPICIVLGMAYVLICKFDFRSNTSPYPLAMCQELVKRNLPRAFGDDSIRYYMKYLGHKEYLNRIPDLSQAEASENQILAAIRRNQPVAPFKITETIYEPKAAENILEPIVRFARKWRMEYPPYLLVILERSSK